MRSAVQLWRNADYGLRSRQICSNQSFHVLLQKAFSADSSLDAASLLQPDQATLSVGDQVSKAPLGATLSTTNTPSPSDESHKTHGLAPPAPSHPTESSAAVRAGLPPGETARGVTNFVRRQPKPHRFPVRISNISRSVLMLDVLRFFKGCELKEDDVRVEYSSEMNAVAMIAFFKSEELRNKALRRTMEFLGGRRINLDPLPESEAEQCTERRLGRFSRGRYLLVMGVPDLSSTEDVMRFFTGFNMMAHPITIVRTQDNAKRDSAPMRGAGYRCVARFVSPEEAQRAVRTKQNSFIMGSKIKLRVLA